MTKPALRWHRDPEGDYEGVDRDGNVAAGVWRTTYRWAYTVTVMDGPQPASGVWPSHEVTGVADRLAEAKAACIRIIEA